MYRKFYILPNYTIVYFVAILLYNIVVASVCGAKVTVIIEGVDGKLYDNVAAHLSLNLQKDNPRLSDIVIRRLHRNAESEILDALGPLGYYNPEIESNLKRVDGNFLASYQINKGAPTRVLSVKLSITGEGANNVELIKAKELFPFVKGTVLDQGKYTVAKRQLIRSALAEGFLDTQYTLQLLKINRAQNSGEIKIILNTGRQYFFGPTTSAQQILHQGLLNRYLPYDTGDPYKPSQLFELQTILGRTDYFKRVIVKGHPEKAEDAYIPIDIDLVPWERRNKYSLGAGYATDTGARFKVDWDNRLFNIKGHKLSASFQIAELENKASFLYKVPFRDPQYEDLAYTIGYKDKNWEDTTTRLFTAAFTYEYSKPRFKWSAGLEYRDELYDVGDTNGDSVLLVPSLTGGVTFADDILNTSNGLQLTLELLGGVDGVVSDVTFGQASGGGKVVLSPFKHWRLIGRGSLGVTFVDSIDKLPPSLRFYTGGDNSIRGYGYKTIGTKDSAGKTIGGRYLVVGSIELERDLTEQWSVAAFWDGGTATDDLSLNFHQGVGGGIRYRLPFGQVRLDLASAITEDGFPFRIHFSVGGDL